MDASGNTALVIALVIAVLLLLLFGGGMASGTMFSGGMMGSGSMGGISWMWLPTLLIVVLAVAPFFGHIRKEVGQTAGPQETGQALAAGGMMQHHAMMEKRMDMMQMTMEHMMQHDQATAPMPVK